VWGEGGYPILGIISKHRTRAAALAKERHCIAIYSPPVNIAETGRPRGLPPDAMPIERARKIWHGHPKKVNKDVVAKMPGWTLDGAKRILGRRELYYATKR